MSLLICSHSSGSWQIVANDFCLFLHKVHKFASLKLILSLSIQRSKSKKVTIVLPDDQTNEGVLVDNIEIIKKFIAQR